MACLHGSCCAEVEVQARTLDPCSPPYARTCSGIDAAISRSSHSPRLSPNRRNSSPNAADWGNLAQVPAYVGSRRRTGIPAQTWRCDLPHYPRFFGHFWAFSGGHGNFDSAISLQSGGLDPPPLKSLISILYLEFAQPAFYQALTSQFTPPSNSFLRNYLSDFDLQALVNKDQAIRNAYFRCLFAPPEKTPRLSQKIARTQYPGSEQPLANNGLPARRVFFRPRPRIPASMVASAFSSLVPMETEESQIARGLRQRDPDLLDALMQQYQHRLLRYLLHLTGNRAVAEDLFQETWLRVLEKGHLYDGRNRFVTWLMSHRAQRRHRLPAQAPSASLDEMQDPEDGAPFEPPADGPSPFDQAVTHSSRTVCRRAAASAAPLFREVLVLRFQEQMKLEEIAQLVHIPVATVKTRIYRGVQALRPLLQGRRAMTDHEHERAHGADYASRHGRSLPRPTVSWLDAHLATCAGMRRVRRRLRRARAVCCGVAVTASPSLVASTQRRLRARAARLRDQQAGVPDCAFVLHWRAGLGGVGPGCGGASAAGRRPGWDCRKPLWTRSISVVAVAGGHGRGVDAGVSALDAGRLAVGKPW